MKIWEAEERRGWEAIRTENMWQGKKKITEPCGKRTQWNRSRSNNIKERPDDKKEMWIANVRNILKRGRELSLNRRSNIT